MNNHVTAGTLIDLRGVDIASLLKESAESDVETALDRILLPSAGGCNGFSNSIS